MYTEVYTVKIPLKSKVFCHEKESKSVSGFSLGEMLCGDTGQQ
jgi:hypothetical protein